MIVISKEMTCFEELWIHFQKSQRYYLLFLFSYRILIYFMHLKTKNTNRILYWDEILLIS